MFEILQLILAESNLKGSQGDLRGKQRMGTSASLGKVSPVTEGGTWLQTVLETLLSSCTAITWLTLPTR